METREYADAVQAQKNSGLVDHGYTVRLKVKLPVEEGSRIKAERPILYSVEDMGRRAAKSAATKINDYIFRSDSSRGGKKDSVNIGTSKVR